MQTNRAHDAESKSNWRTDLELEAMLAETGDWVIYGAGASVVRQAPSLETAIRAALKLRTGRQRITAIALRPNDHILIFEMQIERLARLLRTEDRPAA